MNLFCMLLLMILCHIIDDFVLQPICLSKLKQKSWWEKNVLSESKSYRELYQNDYKIALLIHSLSWSIMIMLPFIFFGNVPWIVMFVFCCINCLIHYRVDDAKANQKKLNLKEDQTAHFLQIIITFFVFAAFSL